MGRAVSIKAKIAQIWLQVGDLPKALAQIEKVLPHLSQTDQSMWLETTADYLICYQVLAAGHDSRAATLLQQGYQTIKAQAATITDESLRHSYLTNVPANRALLELAHTGGVV